MVVFGVVVNVNVFKVVDAGKDAGFTDPVEEMFGPVKFVRDERDLIGSFEGAAEFPSAAGFADEDEFDADVVAVEPIVVEIFAEARRTG